MKRREFLSSTFLSTLGLGALGVMALARPAHAFAVRKCSETEDAACRELERHHMLLAQLQASLAAKGLTEQERQAMLAAAVCPVCGQPLLG